MTEAANAAVISDVATDYQRSQFFFLCFFRATVYVSAYYCICVLTLLCMYCCICVLTLLHMCPHTPLSAQSVFFFFCFHTTMCVQHTTEYLSSHYYLCVRIRLSAHSASRLSDCHSNLADLILVTRITNLFLPI